MFSLGADEKNWGQGRRPERALLGAEGLAPTVESAKSCHTLPKNDSFKPLAKGQQALLPPGLTLIRGKRKSMKGQRASVPG